MTTTCTTCGADNREGRRFCAECGAPLDQLTCSACGAANQPGERFCGDCGKPLPDPATPAGPVVNVGAERTGARPALEGERKQVTVLFADVSGSMDLQEGLDAELWAGIMARFFSLCAEAVEGFGGTVDKFTGDGIMALFGAPVAYEDHARRACLAALQMRDSARRYGEELRSAEGVELHVRIGCNSGEVIAGGAGDAGLEYTALGHTVGLAQRLETLGEPGQVYVSEHTAGLVARWFRLRRRGPVEVKGLSRPVGVFVVEGVAAERAGYGPARPPTLSPLLGRAEELAVLEEALTRAQAGDAQVLGIVGEAGVGKSRLCEEFARSCMASGLLVRHTAGLSHAQDVPFLPILGLLRDYFSITGADRPAEAREKIARRLLGLDAGFASSLPLMFDLLEVPDPDRSAPTLAPEARLRRILQVLRRATQRRSERELLVLVLEDLHWFDPDSAAFLDQLIPSFPGTRTLVVTNFRPEFHSPWMGHSYYRQLPLRPLAADDVRELLARLIGSDPSLAPVIDHVLARTGGNPFFVEEVVRTLVEDGTLEGAPNYRLVRPLGELRVPATVHATLAARIDRLPAPQKALLQTAAVIGRTFSEVVLDHASGRASEDLEGELAALCAAEFLQAQPDNADAQYRFWHPLTQEVAYHSLLTEQRRTLHAAVARSLVEADPDRADERAVLIAGHFEQAGQELDTARWSARAATWVQHRNLAEAVRRWWATVTHLADVEPTEETRALGGWARARLLQLGSRTGLSLSEADRLVAEGRALAEGLSDPEPLIAVNRAFTVAQFLRGEVAASLAGGLEVARLGDEVVGPDLRSAMWSVPSIAYSLAGPLGDGLAANDVQVGLSRDNPECGVKTMGFSALTHGLLMRARLLGQAGRLAEARQALDRGCRLARDRSELEWLSWALASDVDLAGWTGEDHEASSRAREAITIAEESGSLMFTIVALGARGLAELLAGRHDEAVGYLGTARDMAGSHHTALFEEPVLLAHLAEARLGQGDTDAARGLADEAVGVARRQGARVVEVATVLTRSRALRAVGRRSEAAADIASGLAMAAETGAATYEPFLREERARLHQDSAGLREALRLYEAIGATGHARRLRTELGIGT